MADSTLTPYDEVPYPSAVYGQTHPDRLATMAALFGMNPTPVECCRVLELGCGDGSNLIPMAFGLQQSEFVGIDFAKRAIKKGKTVIEQLSLKNITLLDLDLLQFPPNLGRFDYIIAHGLYSWVPTDAREKILSICSRNLSSFGVAYVSYNAYPGNHLRDMVRSMMRYHASHFRTSEEQIHQARALLKFIAEAKSEPDVYTMLLKREFERTLKYIDAGFFHDDLSPMNHPVYFHEFTKHAKKHGLQYLAEADIGDMDILDTNIRDFSPHVAAVLGEMDSGDVITREQYLDFLRCRAFRQTLLCHDAIQLERALKPERIQGLFVAADARSQSKSPDLGSREAVLFCGPMGTEIETDRPLVKTALHHLGTIWPRSEHFRDLVAFVCSQLGREERAPNAGRENDAQELGNALLRGHAAGFVEFHVHKPRFVTEVSEYPEASSLARRQIQEGNLVSTLLHKALKIEDSLGRHLLGLLDETRDRSGLLRDLGELIRSGAADIYHEGKPVSNVGEALKYLADQLEQNLQSLAHLALLIS